VRLSNLITLPRPWHRQALGDFPVYQPATISWLPGVVQGFTTRQGGVSLPPYNALNLATHVGDDPVAVEENRSRLLNELGLECDRIALAEQVHGARVAVVERGGEPPAPAADALVTNRPGVLLTLFFADCVPVYIYDPIHRAIGLAHAGWRGAAANIAGTTLAEMSRVFGSRPGECLVAVGPSISGESYQVGGDVADRFRNLSAGGDSGAAVVVLPSDEFAGKYLLDLRQVVFSQFLRAGVPASYIAVCDEDTYRNSRDFFSYRRDGITGRMAAYMALDDSR
jgi:YfiH family protein